jgi:hypothetical protein
MRIPGEDASVGTVATEESDETTKETKGMSVMKVDRFDPATFEIEGREKVSATPNAERQRCCKCPSISSCDGFKCLSGTSCEIDSSQLAWACLQCQ